MYNRFGDVDKPYEYKPAGKKTALDLLIAENGDAIVLYEVKNNEN